jgi:hypothetical protein
MLGGGTSLGLAGVSRFMFPVLACDFLWVILFLEGRLLKVLLLFFIFFLLAGGCFRFGWWLLGDSTGRGGDMQLVGVYMFVFLSSCLLLLFFIFFLHLLFFIFFSFRLVVFFFSAGGCYWVIVLGARG